MKVNWIYFAGLTFLLAAMIWPISALAGPNLQPAIPHSLEGKASCGSCHRVGGSGVGVPGGTGLAASHLGRTDATCTACHTAAQAGAAPTATPSRAAVQAAPAAPKPDAAQPSSVSPKPDASPVTTPAPLAASQATALPNAGELEDRISLVVIMTLSSAGLTMLGFGLKKFRASQE